MKKRLLIFGVIAVLVITGTIGAILISKKTPTTENQAVLSDTSIIENLPVLQIFSGNIEIKKQEDSGFSSGANGQKIPVGTVIRTDGEGRGELLYPNHSVTRIDFNSQMTLKEFSENPSTTNVLLEVGRIWSRVAKLLGKNDSSTTETTTLVASVRGTSYGLGILSDGSNKISVGKSTVHVECSKDTFNTDVTVNKKLTTKCSNSLQTLNWDNSDKGDEWFNWNLDQDKKLNDEFGGDTYDDEPSPTPTPKPTATPTAKPSATPTPTPTSTPTSTPTPVPTASPTPNFSITNVSVTCNNAGRSQTQPCGDVGYSLELSINGTGFDSKLNPSVNLINTSGGTNLSTGNLSYDGSTYANAKFSSSGTGTFEVHYIQNNQDVKYNQTITLP